MQTELGWILIIFPGALFLAQLVSSLNFPLAQKLGLQEKSGFPDPLFIRAERYTAWWDWSLSAGYQQQVSTWSSTIHGGH